MTGRVGRRRRGIPVGWRSMLRSLLKHGRRSCEALRAYYYISHQVRLRRLGIRLATNPLPIAK